MNKGDKPQPFDILAAVGLLTRLPVRIDPSRAAARGAAAAWAWPIAGAVIGIIGAFAGWVSLELGVTPEAVAALVLAVQMIATGALHEDGLADTVDGLWGGFDRSRRLEIMKDSRIGTYGVLGLFVVTLLRWQALAAIFTLGVGWPVLLAAGAISRAPMAVIMSILPNARGNGISQSVGRPSGVTAAIGVTLALSIGAVCVGPIAVPASIGAAMVCSCLAMIAKAKIGGQTGDILGASQQLSEAVLLTVFVVGLP